MIIKKLSIKTAGYPEWFGYGIGIIGIHVLGLTLLILASKQVPQLIGLGFIAYTLGLRHAFDADHIAAIDNTVRKLIQQGENSLGVGFYFSLGHSSVVFLMTFVAVVTTNWLQQNLPHLQDIGGLIGTAVSGSFLLLIGLINLFIWFDLYNILIKIRQGDYVPENIDKLLLSRGLMARLIGGVYRLINKSWHIYPVGFLFGLGFDTATEVLLLAMSVGAAKEAVPIMGIMSLPLLFAAGMTLMDTADGIFMTKAYNWAFYTPFRKIYYNLTVTGLSVVAAVFIGSIELVQVLTPKLGLYGGVWGWFQGLDFSDIGYLLVFLFVLTWAVSYGFWKILRLES